MILKFTTSTAQVTTIPSKEDQERTALYRSRRRVSLKARGEREPEAHQASWKLEASMEVLPSRHASWNAEQAMSRESPLDGEARLGTSESDRR